MRYCRFQGDEAQPWYGVLGQRSRDTGAGNPPVEPREEWIERLMSPPEEDAHGRLAAMDKPTTRTFQPCRLADVRLLPPVTPGKIICVGRNYRDHAAELGNPVPQEPMLFFKPPSSLLAPDGVIEVPAWAGRVDFEGELGIVLGRRARHIGADEDVAPYIRGYTLVNDVSARALQQRDGQWARAKGMDTFCPVGPWISDEIAAGELPLQTRQNGVLRQDGTTRDLIFSIARLLRFISAAMTLEPGDLVATGTPAGVGPLAEGDIIEISAPGLGVLRNSVRVLPTLDGAE